MMKKSEFLSVFVTILGEAKCTKYKDDMEKRFALKRLAQKRGIFFDDPTHEKWINNPVFCALHHLYENVGGPWTSAQMIRVEEAWEYFDQKQKEVVRG